MFVYTADEGKDFIPDFTGTDMLHILNADGSAGSETELIAVGRGDFLTAKIPSKSSAGFLLAELVVEMNNRAVVVMKFNQPPLKFFPKVAVAH